MKMFTFLTGLEQDRDTAYLVSAPTKHDARRMFQAFLHSQGVHDPECITLRAIREEWLCLEAITLPD